MHLRSFCLLVPVLSLRVLLTQSDPPQAGFLNTTTGELVTSPVKFPAFPQCAGWNLGDNGTRGQTSAVFDMNGTWFVLAEGTGCEVSTTGSLTTLFAITGPYSTGKAPLISTLANLSTTSTLANMSIAWDYTCNVVVLSREQTDSQVTYKTNQVSYYDGQQRMQADYTTEPVKCADSCWRKVAGVGGIDPGTSAGSALQSHRAGDKELNCGDACAFYSIEEQLVDEKVVLPRRLIGRSFRTGKLLVNVTDTLQVQTLTYSSPLKVFLGVGRCCKESWCDEACKDIPDQDLVLLQYVPQKQAFVFKAHIGPEIGEDPTSAIRLGVESNGNFRQTQAFIVYNNHVVTYDLTSFASTSVPLSSPQFIGAWAQTWSNQ